MATKNQLGAALMMWFVASFGYLGAALQSHDLLTSYLHSEPVEARIERIWYTHGRKTNTPHLQVAYTYQHRDYHEQVTLPMFFLSIDEQPGDTLIISVDPAQPEQPWFSAGYVGLSLQLISLVFFLLFGLMMTIFGILMWQGKGRVK